MYRVHALVVVVRTRSHVALDANYIYIHDIFSTFDLYCGYSIQLNENPNSAPLLLSLVKFMQ